jgi:hypothetical protein
MLNLNIDLFDILLGGINEVLDSVLDSVLPDDAFLGNFEGVEVAHDIASAMSKTVGTAKLVSGEVGSRVKRATLHGVRVSIKGTKIAFNISKNIVRVVVVATAGSMVYLTVKLGWNSLERLLSMKARNKEINTINEAVNGTQGLSFVSEKAPATLYQILSSLIAKPLQEKITMLEEKGVNEWMGDNTSADVEQVSHQSSDDDCIVLDDRIERVRYNGSDIIMDASEVASSSSDHNNGPVVPDITEKNVVAVQNTLTGRRRVEDLSYNCIKEARRVACELKMQFPYSSNQPVVRLAMGRAAKEIINPKFGEQRPAILYLSVAIALIPSPTERAIHDLTETSHFTKFCLPKYD